ncbi:MAG: hypothetical protein Q4G13_00395 [Moraxella sp.]|nr:hypothetical protein [Moraxella sp.]
MKKNQLMIILGVLTAAVVALVALIAYFRPNDVQKSASNTAQPMAMSDSANNNAILHRSEMVNKENGNREPLEKDFNREVYGENYEQTMSVGRELDVASPYSNQQKVLNDTSSDPDIQPIHPAQDPANQLYRPSNPTAAQDTVALPAGETGGVEVMSETDTANITKH